MRMVIGGDFFPPYGNERLFSNEKKENKLNLFEDEIVKSFEEADFSLVNLEGVFTDIGKPIKKSGPNIKAARADFYKSKVLKLDLVGISNNHVMDYGKEGLQSTVELLDSAGIGYVGAGKDRQEAACPYIFQKEAEKVGVIACVEHEGIISGADSFGTNPYDETVIEKTIRQTKADVDYLVLLYHGGSENYRYPAPYLRKRCRYMVDCGADIVLCQHSHCIGAMEQYGNGEILYGQGNFFFGRAKSENQKSGLLVLIDTETRQIDYKPVVRSEKYVRFAVLEEEKKIMDGFLKRTNEIKDDEFVENEYLKFAKNRFEEYEQIRFGKYGEFAQKIRHPGLMKFIRSEKTRIDLLNLLRCEAHRELYIKALENYSD